MFLSKKCIWKSRFPYDSQCVESQSVTTYPSQLRITIYQSILLPMQQHFVIFKSNIHNQCKRLNMAGEEETVRMARELIIGASSQLIYELKNTCTGAFFSWAYIITYHHKWIIYTNVQILIKHRIMENQMIGYVFANLTPVVFHCSQDVSVHKAN